jgi:hypothetical protein
VACPPSLPLKYLIDRSVLILAGSFSCSATYSTVVADILEKH